MYTYHVQEALELAAGAAAAHEGKPE